VGRRPLLLVFVALFLFSAAPAEAGWTSDARAIQKGLTASVHAHRLTRGEAYRYRVETRRARALLPRLPWTRAANLGAVLHDVALQSRRYSRPRALTLFSMLRVNRTYLGSHSMPSAKHDVLDGDGVVYRSFPGQGLQFHPLGNFARLNGRLMGGHLDAAAKLAAALQARAISKPGRSAVWEYLFPFGGGRPPWTSGMAQAVAAQSLARAGDRLGKPDFVRLAGRAFRIVPRHLIMPLSSGPWIRHYSFGRLVVLNSQLQSELSIQDYGEIAHDAAATSLAARMRTSSARALPRFDTGYWSLYAPGVPSPLSYHVYVVSLLRKLANRTGAPVWENAAARFNRYTHEPPKLRGGPTRKLIYPWPADGFRDSTMISFWLSKPSTVTLRIGGERRRLSLGGGWHRLRWKPGRRAPRLYRPFLSAVDWAGNRANVGFASVRIAVDRTPPDVSAWSAGSRIVWRAKDATTPWVRLSLHLSRGGKSRVIRLGDRALHGSLRVRLAKRWQARLVVSDSSGNRSITELGTIGH
jgi:hypothetical protein